MLLLNAQSLIGIAAHDVQPEPRPPEVSGAVWLLDVQKSSGAELVAAVALQGLANRTAPRVFLQTGQKCWATSFKGHGVQEQNYRGADDVWIEYYRQSHGFCFEALPTIDALAEKVGPLLKGVVLYKDAADAGFPVAITLAGLKNGVPVTESLLKATPHLAALPVLGDLRGRFQDRLNAHEWAIGELLPATAKKGAFSLESANDHYGLDLAIARRMFVYKLAHTTPEVVPDSDKERQRASKPPYGLDWPDAKLVSKILAHLDPVSPVWGWGGPTEAVYLRKVSQSGAFVECSHVPNMSFHAQVKPLRPQLRQKKHLAPDEVKLEDMVYLAFMVNEGDTAKSMVGLMNSGTWLQPERGKLPVNWGISPYLCEQFPGMMEYYYDTMTENDYFFDGPNGLGYAAPGLLPGATQMKFAERTLQGNQSADTQAADIWYFYGIKNEAVRNRWLAAMGLIGLSQWTNYQKIIYPPDCPPIVHSNHYYDGYEGREKMTPEAYAKYLIEEQKQSPRPWFTVVYAGDLRFFYEIGRHLPEKQFKIVRLDELYEAARQARAKVEGKLVKPQPQAPYLGE